jgi:glyoxylase-like metal-dependent hydrolase (beta-lactamase superfamily II)
MPATITQPDETINNQDGTITYTFFEKVTSTWTYLVTDTSTSTAVLIDPVLDYDLPTGKISTETADGILAFIRVHKFRVVRVMETHAHADHLTAAQYFKLKCNEFNKAEFGLDSTDDDVLVCIGVGITSVQKVVKDKFALDDASLKTDGSQFDVLLKEGDTFTFGKTECKVFHTPGHTPDSNTFLIGGQVYTGKTKIQSNILYSHTFTNTHQIYMYVHNVLIIYLFFI